MPLAMKKRWEMERDKWKARDATGMPHQLTLGTCKCNLFRALDSVGCEMKDEEGPERKPNNFEVVSS